MVRSAPCLLVVLAACSGAGAPRHQPETREPMPIQFAFYRLHDDHVQLSVDGRIVFDRDISVARDNARLGLAAVVQIELPTCSDVVVKMMSAQVAQRICLTPQTRSVFVDGCPLLTIVAKDRFQRED